MNKKEKKLINKFEKIINQFESENDNCVIGCLISLPSEEHEYFHQWNGEKFKKMLNKIIELFNNV